MATFDDSKYNALFDDVAGVIAHRASFLAEIKAGAIPLAAVFARALGDPVLSSMKVLPAIEGLPEAGKVQTRRAFEELHVSEAALLAEVGQEAIDQLPVALARHAL